MTPRLLVQLLQGSFFTIVPSDLARGQEITPRWYHGNVYAMERALPQAVDLPVRPNASKSTQYTIFISGDFEVYPCRLMFPFQVIYATDRLDSLVWRSKRIQEGVSYPKPADMRGYRTTN